MSLCCHTRPENQARAKKWTKCGGYIPGKRAPSGHQNRGAIQYDAAIDVGVARTKAPDSEVAGHATVFVFRISTQGNYIQGCSAIGHAVAIGPVLQGLNKPVNDLSRGCTVLIS